MKRERSAARGIASLLATFLVLGAVNGIAPAMSQTVAPPSDLGRQVTAQLGSTSGAERYRILHNLNAANRIASGLTVADLNAIIAGMEDQRAKVVSLMANKLQPNLSAAEVVALSGQTRGTTRYGILHNLNAANRIASGLTVADLNAIIAGMEDQRAKVISLMARKLQPNLSAADVVALLGETRGSTRYGILHNLNAANRIASGLTVADLNAIVAGMEDQRAKVVSLMARKLQPNLTARLGADEVAAGSDGVVTSGDESAIEPIPPLGSVSPPPNSQPPPEPQAGFLGACGSSKDFPIFGEYERFFVGDYLCFASGGLVAPVPGAICAVGVWAAYKPVYFGEACLGHDRCYGRARSRKSQCDEEFLSLMEMTCDTSLPDMPRVSWQRSRQTCRGAAVTAYETVRAWGCEAFLTGQQASGVMQPTCD
jgi:hypothetical protein